MVRLLNAGFSRLLHYKQLYIAVILSFFLSASLTLSNIDSSNGIIAGETLNTMPVVGVFAAAVLGLFIGTEYSDGTMRNKLTVGTKRRNVYFTNYIISPAVCTVICISAMTGSAAACLLTGAKLYTPNADVSTVMLLNAVGVLLMSFSIAGIITFICMMVCGKAAGGISALLVMIVMVFLGSWAYSRLCKPEFVSDMMLVNNIPQSGPKYLNPSYVGGGARSILELAVYVMPATQGMLMVSDEFYNQPICYIGSIALAVGFTAVGAAMFSKKDIK